MFNSWDFKNFSDSYHKTGNLQMQSKDVHSKSNWIKILAKNQTS